MFLRFIGGEFEGAEFPLKKDREFTVGRGSEHDMVLDEDMVSRAHARITTFDGQVVITDLNSTNGTIVNGDRITSYTLKGGDEILIGRTTLQFLLEGTATEEIVSPLPSPPVVAPRETMVANVRFMSGKVGGGSLTFFDLFDDMLSAKVTGTFEIVHGADGKGYISFKGGKIYGARLELPSKTQLVLPTRKACLRMLLWDVGRYQFTSDASVDLLDTPMEVLELLDAARTEKEMLEKYGPYLPDPDVNMRLANPLTAKLSALSAEVLDTLQLVINHTQVRQIIDRGIASDFEIYQDLLYLIQNGYIETR